MSGATVLDVCSGIGGLSLAAKEAFGGITIGYCEIDPYCQAVLCARMRDGRLDSAPIWPDLRTFDGLAWRGAVDCIVAGFPCQPFSTAGRRQGAQDDRNLWPFVYRAIEAVQPQCVFLENVANALQYFWDVVLPDLSAMGYEGPPPVITAAAEVGAGHIRKRVYTLAYRGQAARELIHAHTRGERVHVEPRGSGGTGGQEALFRGKATGDGELNVLAHADSRRSAERERETMGRAEHDRKAPESRGGVPADYDRSGCNGTAVSAERRESLPIFAGGSWWAAEPSVGRLVHGLSHRMDGG